ncbi:MAG: ABC transporter ATP-binding protein [Clostridia bacterium]|nr:ABC transporter ATP-binding protein [Clostridia bacterium]
MHDDIILKVNHLIKKYDTFELKDINFELPKGYIMGFVGQNGAGKSTTLKCIMNLIEYESGNIEVLGKDSKKYSEMIKSKVGYVSEEQYFYEEMTVDWTNKFVKSFYGEWDQSLLENLLNRFHIDRTKTVKELSKGMKVKLSVAHALAHNPKLLILDEPTSGLDPVARNELMELFLDIIQDEDRSILFSSHITSDIEKIADYITVINNGRIIVCEEKNELFNKWKIVKADKKYLNTKAASGLKGIEKGEFGFSGITDNIQAFDKIFHEQFTNGNYLRDKVNLEELLLRLVKEVE